ncbi:class I SAM-dependent methyltransferase [Orrella daihaiensis]|uniref:SAM-dependent methyltransferase n=1 Tax=Orrella daihaiensis TaxID=2782176 RepID=A0ABY4AJ68_9BURK|nr:SAM-dependent methyltransferase [Orrella daihaiensis]UOD50322.1 SAM-dependent methyltransferase [Orrella daihaiensis]
MQNPHGQRPDPAQIHLSADALAHSEKLTTRLRDQIAQAGGWMSFAQWMQQALYEPGLGYYSAGLAKLATRDTLHCPSSASGDFVTAPELSAAFGYTLAQQVAQVLREQDKPTILEFGAGSGQLAHDVLTALADQELHPHYHILEVSADLRERQQLKLAHWGTQVQWLDQLPDTFIGVVLANEVLDAMPVHLVGWTSDGTVFERGVAWGTDGFVWEDRPAGEVLANELAGKMPPLPGYLTEINLAGRAWINEVSQRLQWGIALLIDYGFPQAEYYHPQRREGTLMCHIQHRSHAQPLILPGLQDITAHVDFSAMASAAFDAGLNVLGYTSQARFLLNAGLLDILPKLDINTQRGIDKLISEAEMGELFKVLAVGRGIDSDLIGFSRGDRRHQL